MDESELFEYVAATYGAQPEYLWAKFPGAFVFRHRENQKWFCVGMEVERAKLGLPVKGSTAADEGDKSNGTSSESGTSSEKVQLIDVKTGPIVGGSYLRQPGIVKAWHMNKNHWLGILLDGSASEQTVKELLDISFCMTR